MCFASPLVILSDLMVLSLLQFLIRMSLELPPDTSDLMAGWSSNPLPGAVDPLALVHSTWALEAFIDVGACTPPRHPSCFACALGKYNSGVQSSSWRSIAVIEPCWLRQVRFTAQSLQSWSSPVHAEQLHRTHMTQDAILDMQ